MPDTLRPPPPSRQAAFAATTLEAEVCGACSHCGEVATQRWRVVLARPNVCWSRCEACDRIGIWERGRLAHPPHALPLPAPAAARLVARARDLRSAVSARLRASQDELSGVATRAREVDWFITVYRRLAASEGAPTG